ncbi:hypothetical protein ACFZDG_16295 [Kitasatospora xanthocidica]|uniref:hypothetical protein n=1 Tax=Kitasatospora xanthocidica TaxID=83382 RepID=UPI0036ED992C
MDTGMDLAGGLASAAAGHLVGMLTTDGWAAVKTAVLALWRHSHPERLEAELVEARSELLQAEQTGDSVELQELLVAEWQARFAGLIADRPEAIDELRAQLLQDPRAAGRPATASTTLEAHVSGGGDAYLAGRDMTVTRDGTA